MKRILLLIICMIQILANPYFVLGEDCEKFEIKIGTHESAVNAKYGKPIASEKIKEGFWPISKKKALYKIDESDYMILYFFSGRIKNVSILDNADETEAISAFKNDQGK